MDKRTEASQAAQAEQDQGEFRRLLEGYDREFRRWREQQVTRADDFSLVELLSLVSDENRHSDVLAWLLSADVYRATHSQGNLGFRIFLAELGLPAHYADGDYSVEREVPGKESRVDIEVRGYGEFIIDIEVKIGAGEGEAQLPREWCDLAQRAESCVVPEAHVHALYLTRNGELPSYPRFRPISWGQIASVFDKFGEQAKAESVRWFAGHYAKALRKFIVQQQYEENGDG
ncbi:MAG: PD-(D/E)XK nuclease family protein [Planctomycetota bacterium]|nr:PD-(D/E)XK nuclease family protein [Planctomycetota bacterium]